VTRYFGEKIAQNLDNLLHMQFNTSAEKEAKDFVILVPMIFKKCPK
jgi:hypothetical protein